MLSRQLMLTHTQLNPRLTMLFGCWNNIKFAYKKCLKVRRAPGMAGMLEALKIKLVGHHHSGIDDSRNIAKIARILAQRGCDITVPNRLLEVPYWYGGFMPYRRTKRGAIVENINNETVFL